MNPIIQRLWGRSRRTRYRLVLSDRASAPPAGYRVGSSRERVVAGRDSATHRLTTRVPAIAHSSAVASRSPDPGYPISILLFGDKRVNSICIVRKQYLVRYSVIDGCPRDSSVDLVGWISPWQRAKCGGSGPAPNRLRDSRTLGRHHRPQFAVDALSFSSIRDACHVYASGINRFADG